MNLCMVGYGAIAEEHMKAFTKIDGVQPHVLVGRRQDPSAEFAGKWGFKHHTLDLHAALADDQVDAVAITSPNNQHVPQAQAALEAGKHVLLEIPIALCLDESLKVTKLSRAVDKRLMICHTMRYMPGLIEVQRRVAEGRFHLYQFIACFGILRRDNTTMHGTPRSWTDNILWHHGAHLVDLALWTSGTTKPTNIDCRFGAPHPKQGVMDVSLTMTLDRGVLATITESYNISQWRWRALFIGHEDTLEFDAGTLYDGGGNVIQSHQSTLDLTDQDAEFINAIREQRDPAISGEEVLPTMRTLQVAQQCAERNDMTGN